MNQKKIKNYRDALVGRGIQHVIQPDHMDEYDKFSAFIPNNTDSSEISSENLITSSSYNINKNLHSVRSETEKNPSIHASEQTVEKIEKLENRISELTKHIKGISQIPSEYNTIVENLNQLNDSIKEMATGFHSSFNGGGGNGMDDLKKRVEELEKKTANIEQTVIIMNEKLNHLPTSKDIYDVKDDITNVKNELLNAIRSLPDENKIESISRSVNRIDNIVTKDHLQSELKGTKLAIFGAAITSLLGLIGTVITAIKLFSS